MAGTPIVTLCSSFPRLRLTKSNSAYLHLNHREGFMSILRTRMNAPVAILFALILTMALPIISSAQGRGNGRGRGPGSNLDKKCGKFVNCHDARDGRLDGRGPGAIQVGQQSDADIFRNRRHRRDRDDEVFYPRSRNRRVDRDGDGDVDRDDEILGRQGRNRRVDRDDWRRGRDRQERIEGRERRARRDGRFDSND